MNSSSIDKEKLLPKILNKESIHEMVEITEDHLKIQSTFQKYTDNSVSKTVNLPERATFDDIKNIYLKAFQAFKNKKGDIKVDLLI